MTDICTYNACPMCGADNSLIDESIGLCKQCGYDGSDGPAFTIQITLSAQSHGNIAASILLPNGTVDTTNISGDMHLGGTFSVPYGTVITLTSTPAAHYNHLAWVGAALNNESYVAGNSTALQTTCVLAPITRAITIGATYDAHIVITWSATAHGNASVTRTVSGVSATVNWSSSNNGSMYVDNNTTVTMVSVPDTGYVHKTWASTGKSATENATTILTLTITGATAVAYAQQLLTPTALTIYTVNDSGASLIRESSPDGKNVTIKYTPSSGKAIAAAYLIDITDFDTDSAPTVSSNQFVADMEDAEDYIIVVVFGAA